MNQTFKFEVIHTSKKSRARVGKIYTPHGVIDTPNFVGVGTNATLKALDMSTTNSLGLQLLFCNTYHLMIQPGVDVIKAAGGLHSFMNRNMPIITDSGGFQVFSLAYGTVKDELKSKGQKKGSSSVLKINENGVLFRSYRDGSPILLTPESSVAAQKDLGADIIIPFDELPPYHIDRAALEASLHRTHRWQERSLATHLADPRNQAMYAVIHGGIDQEFRAISANFASLRAFDGFGIGGSLGKDKAEMLAMLDFTRPLLDDSKPVHLLGIGDLQSLQPCIQRGIDTFDSSYPTRCARHGLIFTARGHRKILAQGNNRDFGPLEPGCMCMVCTTHSMAYVHHLFKAHEMTGYILATLHNVHFMVQCMARYREQILNNQL